MDLQEIVAKYQSGMSLRRLGEELGIDRKKISLLLKNAGVEIVPAFKTTTPAGNHNLTAFRNLSTEEEAYWFGFLSADGAISEKNWHLELTLAEKDKEHVEELAKFLSNTAKPKKKIVNLNNKEYVSYRLTVCSKDICQNLINNGFRLKKSAGIVIPKSVMEHNLLNHFLRGYFEGDGSIASNFEGGWKKHYAYLEFFGYEDFIKQLQQIFHKNLGMTITKLTTHGKARGLRYSSWHIAKKVGDYLYKDATIVLPRKFYEYQKIVDRVNSIAHVKSGETGKLQNGQSRTKPKE